MTNEKSGVYIGFPPVPQAAFNTRAEVIDLALETVGSHLSQNRFHALEIGAMFSEEEGLSTYHICKFLRQNHGAGRFFSLEYNPENVASAKAILEKLGPDLLSDVEFLCGHSLKLLPIALKELDEVDFALIDAAAHPEVCLQEFELVLGHLSENGIIVVDDLQEVAPSEAYADPRPFGKGSLIVPFLVIAEYLRARDTYRAGNSQFTAEGEGLPDSKLLSLVPGDQLLQRLRPLRYKIVSRDCQAMLIVGNEDIVETLAQKILTYNPSPDIPQQEIPIEPPQQEVSSNAPQQTSPSMMLRFKSLVKRLLFLQ